jgi:hypothetical protein
MCRHILLVQDTTRIMYAQTAVANHVNFYNMPHCVLQLTPTAGQFRHVLYSVINLILL